MLAHAALTTHIKTQAKRFCSSVERWGKYALLSGALATSIPQYGCTPSNPAQMQTYQEISKTDISGEVSFIANNQQYELKLVDAFTQQPVKEMYVLITTTDDSAVYFVLDPKNEYYSDIFSARAASVEENQAGIVQQALSSSPDASRIEREIFKKDDVCARTSASQLKDKIPEELVGDSSEATRSKLKELGFDRVTGKNGVKLSELNDTVAALIKFAFGFEPGEVAGKTIEHYLVMAGIKGAKRIVENASAILAVADACELDQQLEYGKYYKNLCYKDEDTFSIYKWNGWDGLGAKGVFNLPDLSFITNPIMIILPDEKPDSWVPPTAHIEGTIEGSLRIGGGFNHAPEVNFKNQTSRILRYWADAHSGAFSLDVSTCNTVSPNYTVFIEEPFSAKVDGYSRTTIPFKQTPNFQANQYELTFVDAFEGCEHTPYYEDQDGDELGNEYKIKVACDKPDGYVKTSDDCNDQDPNIKDECQEKPMEPAANENEVEEEAFQGCCVDFFKETESVAPEMSDNAYPIHEGIEGPIMRFKPNDARNPNAYILDATSLDRQARQLLGAEPLIPIFGLRSDVVPYEVGVAVSNDPEKEGKLLAYSFGGQIYFSNEKGYRYSTTYDDGNEITNIQEMIPSPSGASIAVRGTGNQGQKVYVLEHQFSDPGVVHLETKYSFPDGFNIHVEGSSPDITIAYQQNEDCVSFCSQETDTCVESCALYSITPYFGNVDYITFVEGTQLPSPFSPRTLYAVPAPGIFTPIASKVFFENAIPLAEGVTQANGTLYSQGEDIWVLPIPTLEIGSKIQVGEFPGLKMFNQYSRGFFATTGTTVVYCDSSAQTTYVTPCLNK